MTQAAPPSDSADADAQAEGGPLASPPARCPECGYALAWLPAAGRCPECGWEYDADTVVLFGETSRHERTWADVAMAISASASAVLIVLVVRSGFEPLLLVSNAGVIVGGYFYWRYTRGGGDPATAETQVRLDPGGWATREGVGRVTWRRWHPRHRVDLRSASDGRFRLLVYRAWWRFWHVGVGVTFRADPGDAAEVRRRIEGWVGAASNHPQP